MSTETLKIKTLVVSKPEKVMYPEGFTKQQMVDYYLRAARWLLPHLKNRLVTLKRYPDGVNGEYFYEKDAPSFTPDWIDTFPVPRAGGGRPINYILLNDASTLAWAANTCNLEIHPFLCKVPQIDIPTSVVFDLDPGEGADNLQAGEVALMVRDLLERLKLKCFIKVSGSKGIHLHVPLNSGAAYASTQPFARSIAEALEQNYPDLVVSNMAKDLRRGKVFIDWSQNARHKTTVAAYSLRATPNRPHVAMPITWNELKSALKKRDAAAFCFAPEAALRRVDKLGDLFAPLLKLKQTLPRAFLAMGDTAAASTKAIKARRAKRNFAKQPEAVPLVPKLKTQGGRRLYAIHKHAASHLHYDLRLQMGDALKSWAVPKGPPLAASDTRSAMATEDHPLEYAKFEGIIPAGEYGGGIVMVWDIGSYEIIDGSYWKGELHICIAGAKLKGEWLLRRKDKQDGKRNAWEWIKLGAAKPLALKNASASALTGRTLDQIAAAHDAVWHSSRTGAASKTRASEVPGRVKLEALPGGRLRFVEPMYAELALSLPPAGDWQYEIKLDGYRCLALKHDGAVTLFSRRGNKLNGDFPDIVKQLATLENGTMIDGEIVALEEHGRPSFNLLQNHLSRKDALRYYVFDLLTFEGRSWLRVPLRQRRDKLKSILPPLAQVALSRDFPDGRHLIESVKKMGLEGVIAKRVDSFYEPGKRSGAWKKYKLQAGQECVVGGYKVGNPLQSLLVGVYDNGKLVFLDKVRYGLTPWLRTHLHRRLLPLEQPACPFANLPERNTRKGAVTIEEMQNCRWIKPEVVAQIEFREWTPDGHLRHPTFAGLREDKDAKDVVRERAKIGK